MANTLYTKAKEKILSGEIDFVTDTIKVSLVKNTYPQNLTTDEFYTDISAYVLSTNQTLTAKSVAGGVLDRFAPGMLVAGAGVALLSSAIPYTLEMGALKAMPARTLASRLA